MWAIQQATKFRRLSLGVALLMASGTMLVPVTAHAFIPNPPPRAGSYALVASKTEPAPTTTATIATPGNGASFTDSPITVSGLCTTGLIVQIYDNDTLVGAIDCKGGSFSIQVSLFTGQNDLTAIQYDDLNQASPVSNKVSVTYNNASFTAFGTLITLTSNYGRRAADPGSTLTWPLLLSGGTGPYAFSISWGDGSAPDLKSQALGGEVDITHVYSQAGIYHVTVKVTDANGATAFLQLVAVSNGKPAASSSTDNSKVKTVTVTKVVWWPAVVCMVLLLPTYWLGRRSELVTLHKQLEKDMANYKEL